MAGTSRRVVGIDFGTSTSLTAEGIPRRPVSVVPLGVAQRALPSLVGITDRGLVSGEAAQDLPLTQVARSVKRAITRRQATVPLDSGGGSVDADAAIVSVLKELGARTRSRGVQLEEDSIRLGCPAMWTSEQRTRLLELTRAAGIPVNEHTLIDEPIAAGVAWVSHRVERYGETLDGRLLVFDMGGGTLDVALLDIEAGPRATPEISVLASAGIDEAGDQLDSAIAEDLKAMYAESGVDLDATNSSLEAVLRLEARRVKEILSTSRSAAVALRYPNIAFPELTYTQEQLEDVFSGQLRKARLLTEAVLRESLLTHVLHVDPEAARRRPLDSLANEVRYVLLVGGMSRTPVVGRRLGELFPSAQVYDNAGLGPEEAIVAGLADTAAYERINLHRPGFDFLLEWDGAPSIALYRAFTPFYEPWEAMQRSLLYYEKCVPSIQLPGTGTGRLRIRSAGGTEITLRIDGNEEDGLAVPFGRHGVNLRMFPSGRVVVTDGRGAQHALRISKWPVLRGRDHAFLEAERLHRAPKELPDLAYPHGSRHE